MQNTGNKKVVTVEPLQLLEAPVEAVAREEIPLKLATARLLARRGIPGLFTTFCISYFVISSLYYKKIFK